MGYGHANIAECVEEDYGHKQHQICRIFRLQLRAGSAVDPVARLGPYSPVLSTPGGVAQVWQISTLANTGIAVTVSKPCRVV